MEVPLDLTSKRNFVWPDSDVNQSGGNAVMNSVKGNTDVRMNNICAERLDGFLSEDRVYTNLDEPNSERTDDNISEGVIEERSTIYIKEEVQTDEFEDDVFREGTNEIAIRNESVCNDVCVEGNEGNVVNEVIADGMMEECANGECSNEDDEKNCPEGYILPDVKPRISSVEMENAAATLSMPLLNEGEETKVDGGTAAFLCETMMNITPDKRSTKIAKHYAAIRAKETAEAIEALKKTLHREKNFACNICGNLFKDRRNLNRHIKRIHCDDKKYHCETCGKGFCFVSHLMRHVESHSVEKKHVCETCGRGFNLMSNLERHMITHSQEKPFECCVCGARFSQNYYLQAHAVIHTGEKRFECATCGMKFGNRSNLRRHFRSHSSEKPYSCPICNQRFRFSNNISKHKKKYHKAT